MKVTFVIKELKEALKYLAAMKKSKREHDKIVTLSAVERNVGTHMSVERSAAKVNLAFNIPVNVEEPGSFSCDINTLANFLKYPDGDVGYFETSTGKKNVMLRINEDIFFIDTVEHNDEVPRGDGEFIGTITVPGFILKFFFATVLPLVNPEPDCSTPLTHFVNLELNDGKLICYAANNHRVHWVSDDYFDKETVFQCLLPFNIVFMATKLLAGNGNVKVSYSDDVVCLVSDNFTIRASRQHGEHFSVRKVLEQDYSTAARINVETDQLMSVVKQMRTLVAKNPCHTVKISALVDRLNIIAEDKDGNQIAASSVSALIEGAFETFGVNVNYLFDILNAPNRRKNIVISTEGGVKPIRITDADFYDFIAVVSPVRINKP